MTTCRTGEHSSQQIRKYPYTPTPNTTSEGTYASTEFQVFPLTYVHTHDRITNITINTCRHTYSYTQAHTTTFMHKHMRPQCTKPRIQAHMRMHTCRAVKQYARRARRCTYRAWSECMQVPVAAADSFVVYTSRCVRVILAQGPC